MLLPVNSAAFARKQKSCTTIAITRKESFDQVFNKKKNLFQELFGSTRHVYPFIFIQFQHFQSIATVV
jgi:hypothetical protein